MYEGDKRKHHARKVKKSIEAGSKMQSTDLSREKLALLTRKDLVATSKRHGQKASGTSIQLIEALLLLGDNAAIKAGDNGNILSDVVMLEEVIMDEQKLDDIKNDDVISDSNRADTEVQSTDLSREKLELLTRKELMATSKRHGQKASGTSIQLIEALLLLGGSTMIIADNIESFNKSKFEEENNESCINIIDVKTESLNLDADLLAQEVEHYEALEPQVSAIVCNEGKKKRRTNSLLKADTLLVTSENLDILAPESKPIISDRKRDSRTHQRNSTVKGLQSPSIIPKSTKTQKAREDLLVANEKIKEEANEILLGKERMRQEAMLGKRGRDGSRKSLSSSSSSSSVPPAAIASKSGDNPLKMTNVVKTGSSQSKLPVATQSGSKLSSAFGSSISKSASHSSSLKEMSTSSSSKAIPASPSSTTSTPFKRKEVPDFHKIHAKSMSSLKAITEVVERNGKINVKLSNAMAEAHKEAPVLTASSASSRAQGPSVPSTFTAYSGSSTATSTSNSSRMKSTSAIQPVKAAFKARTMPNFKALHGKMPVRAAGTPIDNKENSVPSSNRAQESDRKSIKGNTISNMNLKRKESFTESHKAKHDSAIALARKSGPFSSNKP